MNPLAVVLDFDGTVTERDVGDAIVKRFGLPGWDALEEEFKRGEVSIRRLWVQEISHLPGDRAAEMAAFSLEVAKVRPGLRELVTYCRSKGIPVEIASNGIEFYISRILGANGLGDLPYVCMGANFGPGSQSSLVIPDDTVQCARNGLCKCARVWRMQKQGRRVVFAGDGASDACVAYEPDVLMARSSLAKMAERDGRHFVPFEDFYDVLAEVKRQGS
jgi:2-hydroxy-3-keto-5-methylthiopentenyl-1-phosphate phosphatase